MSYKVHIESFEGPFDLLLYLVSRQKVDIGAISIAEITDQYLAEVATMRDLDLDVASDFLLVAATLLEIKAASLVPDKKSEVIEEFLELTPYEARDILIERLMEYKKFKNVSSAMMTRYESEARMHARPFGPDRQHFKRTPDFLDGTTLDVLALICAQAYARRDIALLEAEYIAAKPIPIETHVRAIHRRISNTKHLMFSDLVSSTTPNAVLVVTLLAVLELYKRSMITIKQKKSFGDISIEYIAGSGELSFEGNEAISAVFEHNDQK